MANQTELLNYIDALTQLSFKVQITEKDAKDLADKMGLTEKAYKSLKEQINALIPISVKYSNQMHKVANDYKNLQKAIKGNKDNLEEYNKTLKECNNTFKNAMKDAVGLKNAERQHRHETEMLEKAIKIASGSLDEYSGHVNALTSNIKKLAMPVAKVGAIFTSNTLSFKNATDSLKHYNQGVFQGIKTGQLFGRSQVTTGDDIAKAMKTIRTSTVLSSNQFLDFAKSMQQSFVGVAPMHSEMASFASTLQNAFGPNVEMIKSKMEELMGVQNKFPMLYKLMREAQGLVIAGNLKEADSIRATILQRALAAGMTQSQVATLMQATSQTNTAMSSTIDLNQRAAKAEQQNAEAVLGLGQATEGAMKQMASATAGVYEKLAQFPLLGKSITAAFSGMGGAMEWLRSGRDILQFGTQLKMASNIATTAAGTSKAAALGVNLLGLSFKALLGPVGWAIAAIGGAVAIWKIWSNRQKKQREEAEASAKGNKILADTYQAIQAETGICMKTNDQWIQKERQIRMQAKKEGKSTAETYDLITDSLKEMASEKGFTGFGKLYKLTSLQQEMLANYKAQKETIDAATNSIVAQIDATKELGYFNQNLLNIQRQQLKEAQVLTENAAQKLFKNIQDQNVEMGFKVNFGDIDESLPLVDKLNAYMGKSAEMEAEFLRISEDVNSSMEDRKKAEDNLGKMQNTRKELAAMTANVVQSEVGIAKSITDVATKQLEAQIQLGGVMERRLGVERELMEQAQFGMGASVEMMQKQVDLQLTQINLRNKQLKQLDDENSKQENLGKANVEQLKNAKDHNQALAIARKMDKEKPGNMAKAMEYWKKHNELATEQMSSQKKIYELTKDIREGYMDAITAMSIGAGEFSKIIGTQESGVTQLMNVIRDVSGEQHKSFKAGGQLRSGEQSYEARSKSAASYGPQFGLAMDARRFGTMGEHIAGQPFAGGGGRVGTGLGGGTNAGFGPQTAASVRGGEGGTIYVGGSREPIHGAVNTPTMGGIPGIRETPRRSGVSQGAGLGIEQSEIIRVPSRKKGGTVPGNPNEPVLIMAHGQEMVIPSNQTGAFKSSGEIESFENFKLDTQLAFNASIGSLQKKKEQASKEYDTIQKELYDLEKRLASTGEDRNIEQYGLSDPRKALKAKRDAARQKMFDADKKIEKAESSWKDYNNMGEQKQKENYTASMKKQYQDKENELKQSLQKLSSYQNMPQISGTTLGKIDDEKIKIEKLEQELATMRNSWKNAKGEQEKMAVADAFRGKGNRSAVSVTDFAPESLEAQRAQQFNQSLTSGGAFAGGTGGVNGLPSSSSTVAAGGGRGGLTPPSRRENMAEGSTSNATLTIQLAEGLKADIESLKNFVINMQNGASTRV